MNGIPNLIIYWISIPGATLQYLLVFHFESEILTYTILFRIKFAIRINSQEGLKNLTGTRDSA